MFFFSAVCDWISNNMKRLHFSALIVVRKVEEPAASFFPCLTGQALPSQQVLAVLRLLLSVRAVVV